MTILPQSHPPGTPFLADPVKIGVPLAGVLCINVSSHSKLAAVVDALAGLPEVRWVSTTAGRFDIIALIYLSTTEDLARFIEKHVASIRGLKSTETFICLRVRKGASMPATVLFDYNNKKR